MKSFISLCPVIFYLIVQTAPASLNGQVTITSSDMPAAGDTIRFSMVSPADSLDYLSAGPNQTWDFSSVETIGQGLSEYRSATSINLTYGLFFGFSAYGLKIFDTLDLGSVVLYDAYDFYTRSSSVFKAVGRGLEFQGLPNPSFFSDDDEIYRFPLNYQDRDSSTFSVNFVFNLLFSLEQSGHRINEAEGWGTVITPFGTFNSLKVKTTIVEKDSLAVNGVGLPAIERTTVEYKWLAPGEKMPVMEISGAVLAGQFNPLSIRFRGTAPATPNGIQSGEQQVLKLWPVPASGLLYISPSSDNASQNIRIVDMKGGRYPVKLVEHSDVIILDISELNPGIYGLEWLSERQSRFARFVVR